VVVGPRNGGFAQKYSSWQVTYDNSATVQTGTATWTAPPTPPSDEDVLAFKGLEWTLGVTTPAVGDFVDFVDYVSEVLADETSVGPSSWALGPKIDDDEHYYTIHSPIDLFVLFGRRVNGARFTIDNVDESNGQLEFYLRGKDTGGHIFGLEIGLDRQALTWSKNVLARISP
jgi:hypothetical protein